MPPIKTLRDEIMLQFLAPMLMLDLQRQSQGFTPASAGDLGEAAYKSADAVLLKRGSPCAN